MENSVYCNLTIVFLIFLVYILHHKNSEVHRCGASGTMRACHVTGPGSIPGWDRFPGCGFSGFVDKNYRNCYYNVFHKTYIMGVSL